MTVAEAINGYTADDETEKHVKDIEGFLEELKDTLNKTGVLELTFAEVKNNSETFGKTKNALKELVMKRGFCIREYIVYIINRIFSAECSVWANRSMNIINADDVFSPNEIYWKLLKYLQSGDDEERKIKRSNIAERFSMSDNTVQKYLRSLQDGCKLFDADVKIGSLRHAKNTYDDTIHPVFLALNLTEVCMLTVMLKQMTHHKRERFGIFESMASNIAEDIFSQLSDYAKPIIAATAAENGITINDSCNFGFRRERSGSEGRDIDVTYLTKAFGRCKIKLSDDDTYYCGRFKAECGREIFITDDGTDIDVKKRRIIDVKRLN